MGFSRPIWEEVELYASPEDYAECSRLHRMYGTTYYFASRRLPTEIRSRVDALYGFVRVPDEWVDNPDGRSVEETAQLLNNYRQQMLAATYGKRPEHAVMRAFCDVLRTAEIPLEEPLIFLDAMEADLTIRRYATYEELCVYMRGSAAAVGLMMLYVLGAKRDETTRSSAIALGEAMQLTNFLRDIGDDADRGRIYLPLEDMDRFGVYEADLMEGKKSRAFVELMRFEIERARNLFAASDVGIAALPQDVKFGVALARELYAKILDKIEALDYDVFGQRARTTPQEKMVAAWKLWSSNGVKGENA